jgi:hypothetical protein
MSCSIIWSEKSGVLQRQSMQPRDFFGGHVHQHGVTVAPFGRHVVG